MADPTTPLGFDLPPDSTPISEFASKLRDHSTVADSVITLMKTGPTGAKGSTGATGPAGPATTLAMDPTTTLPAGSAATCTVSGASPFQRLAFGIPAGATGAAGPQGLPGVNAVPADAAVAGYVAGPSLTATALVAKLNAAGVESAETITRTNLATSTYGETGWHTSGGYGSIWDPAKIRPDGKAGARKYTKAAGDTGQYFPYGRAAGAASTANPITAPVNTTGLTPVVPGLPYGAGLYMQASIAVPRGFVTFRWVDAAGNFIGAATTGAFGTAAAGAWQWYSHVATAPAGAAYLCVENVLTMITDGQAIVAGSTSWATMALVEQRATAPVAADFIAGDTPAAPPLTYRWAGTAGRSVSYQMNNATVPRRDAAGNLAVSYPLQDGSAANLKAVKDLLTARTGAFRAPAAGELTVNILDRLDPAQNHATTDNLDAIHAALGTGAFPIRLHFPPGVYGTRAAILQPDFSTITGAGKGASTIRLLAGAPNDTWVVTNSNRAGGNKRLRIRDITLDWARSAARPGGAGGSRSSCLTYGNVTDFEIMNVEGLNSGLHVIDVTCAAVDYPYMASGTDDPTFIAPGPSRYGIIIGCEGTAWGDDGLTIHHSEYIYAARNRFYDPRERSNCNGIEVDDGSRHIILEANQTAGCYGGIEVKAHADVNAAQNVHIIGHIDTGSVRSYNFRHIGHHTGTDPVSQTAFDITFSNLVSINANNDKGFQDDSSPRALCISAYKRVAGHGFTAIGRGGYTDTEVAIAIQYRANGVALSGVNITGWGGAKADISVGSGDGVSLVGINIHNSAKRAILVDTDVTALQLFGLNAVAPAAGSMYGVDLYRSASAVMNGINVVGYPVAVRADSTNFATWEMFLNRSAIIAPAITRISQLTPGRYYADSTRWAGLADRPSDALVGGWFIDVGNYSHGAIPGLRCTVTRNSVLVDPLQYVRIHNVNAESTPNWGKIPFTYVPAAA